MKNHLRSVALMGVALSLLSFGNRASAVIGANTPFTCFEAEGGTLEGGATIRSLIAAPTSSASSPELEASGHAFVELNATGESVTLQNNTDINITALNIRYSIPDAPTGGGITATLGLYVNGVFRQTITLNSIQTWCYQTSGSEHGWSQDPSYGQPHIFYDEAHFFITGTAVSPGSTITFRKDSTNTASFYWLDVVDMEAPPAPLSQPANSLSITSYGAVPNDSSKDSSAAIQNCINAARSQGKSVWVPAGTFYLNSASASLSATGITLEGAGMWYSVIYANPTLPASSSNILLPTSCTVRNLAFDSNARSGGAGDGNGGGLNVKGNNWVVDNVWVQHLGAGVWANGSHGIVKNCRTGCTWADGINVNNGNGAVNNNIGYSLTISNCFVRGCGDDGLALNSGNGTGCLQMTNTTVVCNTSVAPWWANNLGIYGGVNILVSNNLCADSVGAFGMSIGQFGNTGMPTESGTVTSNLIVRGGSYGFYNQKGVPALNIGTTAEIKDVYVGGNIINDSLFAAVGFEKCGPGVTVQYNEINAPGTDAMTVPSGAIGTAMLYSNTVTGLKTGRSVLVDNSSTFAIVTPTPACSYDTMSGVAPEACAEGGQALGSIENGDWSAYNGINLTGINAFVARVASANAGGSIQIRLDSPTGTLAATCAVPKTGGAQTYTNVYAKISGVTGTHNVYLVYVGGSGNLFNVEYIGFYNAPPVLTHRLVVGNTYSLRSVGNNKYVTAANGGASPLIAKSTSVGAAEKFKVVDTGGGNIGLMSLVNSQYVCADNGGAAPLIANRASAGSWESFTEVDAGDGNISLRATINSKYVCADNAGASSLIAKSTSIGTWESFTLVMPPAPPSALNARAGYSQIALNWTASPGASGYNIKRSNTHGGPYNLIATNVSDASYTDNDVTNLTSYYYVVSALNDAGKGADSTEAGATLGILDRAGWLPSASASASGSPTSNALDNNNSTRWTSGANQTNGLWFQVDMGTANTFYQIVLDAATSAGDYPRGYQVKVSNDGTNWGSPVASGTGTSAVTTITFPSQAARYIRVIQTLNSGPWWSIHEFKVYGVSGTTPNAPTSLSAVAGDGQVALAWNPSLNAAGYNVKRSTSLNGTYTMVATNVTEPNFTNTGLSNGTKYYFVVAATNLVGESNNSVPASAQPVSMSPPRLNLGISAAQLQLAWPQENTSWRLQMQTNSLNHGSGTNWVTVPASTLTNLVMIPFNSNDSSVFFRLVYP